MKNKALFLDRDGIILQMVYDLESGYIHTALNPKQVVLMYGIIPLLKKAKSLGYKLIVISNQPNIGLKRISEENFRKTQEKMEALLLKHGIVLDGQYYCLHHPFAEIEKYKRKCNCRKPKTALFKKAIKHFRIDDKKSWLVGDGVYDILAGTIMRLQTILLGNIYESEYQRILEDLLGSVKPNYLAKNLCEAEKIISNQSNYE